MHWMEASELFIRKHAVVSKSKEPIDPIHGQVWTTLSPQQQDLLSIKCLSNICIL